MEVLVRPFNQDSDSGLLFSTLPKGIFYARVPPIPESEREAFFTQIYAYAKALVDIADISIAASKESPDLILGYSIVLKGQLEWVFVKSAYRGLGIATFLTKNVDVMNFNPANLTRVGLEIMKKLKKKEELHATEEARREEDHPPAH